MIEEREAHEAFLAGLASAGEAPVDIAEAALRLAALDRPRVDLERYRDHLGELAAEVGALAEGSSEAADALAETICRHHGYAGDSLTYDDLQNANLIRVIDRRKGLPVALGILFMHAGRAQGWAVEGLSFPGHFVIRLERRSILDPFNGGRVCSAGELRQLLPSAARAEALAPEHYEAVNDRTVLMRLQNNIKLRLLQQKRPAKALEVVERMLLFVPEEASLRLEAGVLCAGEGKLRAATAHFETCLSPTAPEPIRHRAAVLLQELRGKLN